jgi:membrane peptidoglycan carboxypeptidase
VKILLFVLKFVLTIALGAAALAGSVALLAPAGRSLTAAATPLGKLNVAINAPASRSIVYDAYGNVMGAFSVEDRQPVKLKDVPQVLQDAVISIEDRKFYEHHGVDYAGTLRALFKNVDAGGISQGGSTITQQLVKNALETPNRKRDLKTKAREAVLAVRVEEELTKSQILEDYLNLVYFGNGAYGVQTAAERYFDKPVKKLSLAEAALLAGLIQSPEALNPIKHPDLAARRRGEVLDAMVETGKTTPLAAKLSKGVPLPTKLFYPVSHPLDYYIDEVKNRLLIDDPTVSGDPAEALGSTQQARANALYRDGLKIYTNLDPFLENYAVEAIRDQLPSIRFTASLVVIDNSTGAVRAIANGRAFSDMQFDPATEGPGRQAGSSFKVFTLAAALSHGYSPNDRVLADPLYRPDLDPRWNPLHGDCKGGTPTLYDALARSDNCAFVRLELSLAPGNRGRDGVGQVVQTAKAMGIDSAAKFDPTIPSTTLGTQGVHPLEMAQAYSVLPNDGVLKRASFITKIVAANGRVLYQNTDTGHRVLDPNVARSEIDIMKGVVRHGTASGTLGGFGRPIAGKTGTTDGPVDAWFVGFTPQLTAAVWMGDPKKETAMVGISANSVQGGTYPAKIWREFMQKAVVGLPPLDFAAPNKALWPRSSYVTDLGRRFSFGGVNIFPTPSTTPPVTTPTGPPVTTPTPTTKPKKKSSGGGHTPPTTNGSPSTTAGGP